MANLKEIRTRIESVQSTEQITTAMRMVSASKLRKAQQAFSSIQPYSDALLEISHEMYGLLNQTDLLAASPSDENVPERVLLFVFSSNKGLCGAFNSNIVKHINELIKTNYKQHLDEGRLYFMIAGRRAGEMLEKQKFHIVGNHHDLLANVSYKDVSSLSRGLYEAYYNGTYHKIILIYNKFKTVLTQELTNQQFLPFLPQKTWQEGHKEPVDFILEPDKETIVKWIFPKILSILLYRTFLESIASEEGARMTAMQQASDNASALIKELKISYNKARQTAITNELLDIIGGAEALNG